MATIDGLAMVARARAFVGRAIIPQGMCLNFVWLRAGGLSSIGASVGRMRTAFASWQATPEAHRHHSDWAAPIGAVVHYGPSPTRRDKNRDAGDIGISIGGGYGIFTDAAGQGSRVGIMTLRARAAQIARPYLGWAESLGGHTIRLATTATAGEIREAIANAPTAQDQEEDYLMRALLIRNSTPGDPNYGSVDLVNLFTGFWWHTPNQGFIDLIVSQNLAITNAGKPWDKPTNEWGWYRDRALEHRQSIANSLDLTQITSPGWNSPQTLASRLAGIDEYKNELTGATIANVVAVILQSLPASAGGQADKVDVDEVARATVALLGERLTETQGGR